MNINIINRAVLSEKAYATMEQGIYTFVVGKRASKKEVKKAIEAQFATRVVNIRFSSFPAKQKRVTGTRRTTFVGGGKKAIVILEKGHKIALLSPKAQKKEKVKKTVSAESAEKKPENIEKKPGGLLSRIRKGRESK